MKEIPNPKNKPSKPATQISKTTKRLLDPSVMRNSIKESMGLIRSHKVDEESIRYDFGLVLEDGNVLIRTLKSDELRETEFDMKIIDYIQGVILERDSHQ